MSADIYKKVRANPKFAELEGKRSRFALLLTAIVMVSYYALMMVIAFAPEVLRTPITEGGMLTIGVPIGAAIIIGSWLLTGWFVSRTGSRTSASAAARRGRTASRARRRPHQQRRCRPAGPVRLPALRRAC